MIDSPSQKPDLRRGPGWLVTLALGATFFAVALVVILSRGWSQATSPPIITAPKPDPTVHQLYDVAIRKPAGPPTIATGSIDEKGRTVSIACASCHATKPSNAEAELGKPLTAFHQKLTGMHGKLSCISCHNTTDGYGSLRLANGKKTPYSEVMMLCAQCHGTQYRDYQHGAHGGMTGYWDLTKGGRTRLNCIDCHDPHAPKHSTVAPVKGPNDRFLSRERP